MPLEGMKLLARLPVRHPCELVRSPGDQKLSVTGKLDRIDHVAVDIGKMLEHGFLGQVPDNDFPVRLGSPPPLARSFPSGAKANALTRCTMGVWAKSPPIIWSRVHSLLKSITEETPS